MVQLTKQHLNVLKQGSFYIYVRFLWGLFWGRLMGEEERYRDL